MRAEDLVLIERFHHLVHLESTRLDKNFDLNITESAGRLVCTASLKRPTKYYLQQLISLLEFVPNQVLLDFMTMDNIVVDEILWPVDENGKSRKFTDKEKSKALSDIVISRDKKNGQAVVEMEFVLSLAAALINK